MATKKKRAQAPITTQAEKRLRALAEKASLLNEGEEAYFVLRFDNEDPGVELTLEAGESYTAAECTLDAAIGFVDAQLREEHLEKLDEYREECQEHVNRMTVVINRKV